MSKFIERWEDELQGILLRGYLETDTDAAMRFRKIKLAAQLLREKLTEMESSITTKPPPALNGNGAPTAKGVRA